MRWNSIMPRVPAMRDLKRIEAELPQESHPPFAIKRVKLSPCAQGESQTSGIGCQAGQDRPMDGRHRSPARRRRWEPGHVLANRA
jgi:hypothetical protein